MPMMERMRPRTTSHTCPTWLTRPWAVLLSVLLALLFLAPGATTAVAAPSADRGVEGGGVEEPRLPLRAVGEGLDERVVTVPTAAGVHTWRTEPFTMLAATWSRPGATPQLEVSVLTRSGWQPWQELAHADHAPNRGSGEASSRVGSDLLWVGPSEGVRLRVRGAAARDLALTLLDTSGVPAGSGGVRPASYVAVAPKAARTTAAKKATKARKRPTAAPKPRIRTRKKWEANEKWRDGDPVVRSTLKQVHVHHTASSNSYRKADVPGILRGFYRYHTKGLGWSDIGYNYLVDRFGRAWKGRWGGPMVQGAHTLGFNHNSIGIALIGEHTSTAPNAASVRTVARIAAWQLDRAGRPARGKVRVTSQGSDRYAEGVKVRLPRIDGHRHTNHTACPGDAVQSRLVKIRRIAQRRIDRF